MSTEIATRAASLTEKIAYSDNLACSDILPKQFREKPANVLWAIEYGETLGITTMAALTGIHVIEGKPGASAALIGGLVRRAGHKLRVTGNNQRATAQIVRSDDPDYTFEVTWELRRNERDNPNAEDAGVLGKQVWKNYPAAMLKARAITQVARDACEEVLFGLHYTPEELGAEVNADGEPLEQRTHRQHGPVIDDPWQTPAPAPTAPTAPAPESEYAEVVGEDTAPVAEERPLPPPVPGVPTVTGEQLDEIAQLLKTKRGAVNGDRNRIISELVRRPVENVRTLSQAEARSIIETLTAEPDQAAPTADAAPPAAAVGTPANPGVTDSQMRMIQALFAEKNITKAQAKRDYAGRMLGLDGPVKSVGGLSKEQASQLLDAMRTGEIPAPAPLIDRLAAQMRGAQSSDELAEHAEWMWKAHEAGELSQAEVSKLQDVSLAREAELQQTAGAS